jgi:hypothetical protein
MRNVKNPRVATAHALRLDACQTGRHRVDAHTRLVVPVTAALGEPADSLILMRRPPAAPGRLLVVLRLVMGTDASNECSGSLVLASRPSAYIADATALPADNRRDPLNSPSNFTAAPHKTRWPVSSLRGAARLAHAAARTAETERLTDL